MKYKDLYPHVMNQPTPGYNQPYKSIEVEVEPNILYSDRYFRCAVCTMVTPFIEINYECHTCSTECTKQLNDNHAEAMQCQPPSAQEGRSSMTSGDTLSSTEIKLEAQDIAISGKNAQDE